MQRRRIARPAQPDRAADEQREDADRRQHEVERAGTVRNRRDTDVEHLARAEPQRRCSEASRYRSASCSASTTSSRRWIGSIVDRQEQIAAAEVPTRRGRSARRQLSSRDDALGARVHSTPSSTSCNCRARGDVRDAKAQQIPRRRRSAAPAVVTAPRRRTLRGPIQSSEVGIQPNGVENSAKKWERCSALPLVWRTIPRPLRTGPSRRRARASADARPAARRRPNHRTSPP